MTRIDPLPSSRPARRPLWSARQIATMALFTALSVIFSFIEIPLMPGAAAFLKFDPANVPALLAGLVYGPAAGCVVGILSAGLHGLFVANPVGALMNAVAVVAFVLPPALICLNRKGVVRMTAGMTLGSVASIAAMLLMNVLITPFYLGVPLDMVVGMLVPVLLPFNIIKAALNSALTAIVYQSLKRVLVAG
ncbi:MAG: ECF transporter S component [Coriobacteriales bacterium]|nr:ECF transporter S component [Coriobacteriales bacterium]